MRLSGSHNAAQLGGYQAPSRWFTGPRGRYYPLMFTARCSCIVLMEEDLIPMSEGEFQMALRITVAALRARKQIRDTWQDKHCATNIAVALWMGGLSVKRQFDGAGIGMKAVRGDFGLIQ